MTRSIPVGSGGDADLAGSLKFAVQGGSIATAFKEVAVGAEDFSRLPGRFLEEFDAEISESRSLKILEKRSAGLRCGLEESVPATDIGAERMLDAHTVAEMNAVLFAGPAAVRMVGAIRHESREDAVLHVKHRHVMVQHQFEPAGRGLAEELQDLAAV